MLKSASANDFVFYSTFCLFLTEIISQDKIISWDNVMIKRMFMELLAQCLTYNKHLVNGICCCYNH